MSANFHKITTVILSFAMLASTLGACKGVAPTPISTAIPTSTLPPTPTAIPLPFPKTVDLIHELSIDGSAVTSPGNCPQTLEGMPDGIVLGVDPQTCTVSESNGTRASLEVYIPADYVNNVFTLRIFWPNENGRGLRASVPEETAQISLDGNIIWEKSALGSPENAFYYAARSEPILLTFVPKMAGNHTIEISLPPKMAWDINTIQLLSAPYPKKILGIAYSPYRDCQNASTEAQPIEENIKDDLYKLAQSATAIRTYSSTGINAKIPSLAAEMGIPIYAGAWLDGNPESDASEMKGIIQIADSSPIKAAIIGNEYYLRHNKQEDLNYLLSRINEFKSVHPEIPVATAETDSFVFNWSSDGTPTIKPEYRPILDEIDVFFVHIYPFWANQPVEGAAGYTVNRYLAIMSLLDETYGGEKHVILGEAGWPAIGGPDNAGYSGQEGNTSQTTLVFHPEAQRQYMIELLALAQDKQVDLFYFDAFDELWKTEGVDGAGSSWGYNYADRTVKFNFSGLLLPPENLPSFVQGDIYNPYKESDFTWKVGEYPIYTEWPREPKGRPQDFPEPGYYFPAYMGDIEGIGMFQCERQSHSGETAIKIIYQPGGEKRWSGAYWLHPKQIEGVTDLIASQQDWGVSMQGIDLPASQKLGFWARGENGNEIVEFVVGGVCGNYDGTTPPLCPDTIQPRITTGPIVLSSTWQKYAIDLRNVDRSNVIGAFGFAVSQVYNPEGATFYLDDIAFAPDPPLATENVYPLPIGSTFSIYTDYTALDNHYIPSNFMGDGEKPGYLTLDQSWNVSPHSGKTAIEVQYSRGSLGWAGVYWTDPENNLGQRPGGYDLTGVKRITFWAKTEHAGQQLKILIGGISCFKNRFPYRDSVCDVVPIPWITLTNEWKLYTVNLTSVNRDWKRLLGGFGIVINQPGTFYLDDIIYELSQ